MNRLRLLGLEITLPLALFGSWWVLSSSSTSLYFPPLRDIMVRFGETWGREGLQGMLLPTLATFALGYVLAVVIGIGIGIALAANRAVADFVAPLLEFLRALPGIALVPAFMAVLGLGAGMRVSVVVFASVWPVLLNTVDGIRGVDVVVRDSSTVFRVPRLQRLLFVTLPGASPQIMAGARIGVSLSLIAVIVTEMVTSAGGVGAFARRAQLSFDLPAMWTAIILMGLVGYTLNLLFDQMERRILRWHQHMQQRVS